MFTSYSLGYSAITTMNQTTFSSIINIYAVVGYNTKDNIVKSLITRTCKRIMLLEKSEKLMTVFSILFLP